MTDFFALLGLPRQPWLDPEALKTRFLELSASAHPDKFHTAAQAERAEAQEHFASLNAAYQCLRDPKQRLAHLLQLETGSKPKEIQSIPAPLADLFVQVGWLCRDVDAFLGSKAKAASPILQAQMFEKGADWTDKLQAMQNQLSRLYEASLAELKAMNSAWQGAPTDGPVRVRALPLEPLEQTYRSLSYLGRWLDQLRERIVRLSF